MSALALLALDWAKKGWQQLLGGLILGLCLGRISVLLPSKAPVEAQATAGAAQSLSGTAEAHSSGTVVIPKRASMPCPADRVCPECPEVRVIYDCGSKVAGGASQGSSATAQVTTPKPGLEWYGGLGSDFGPSTQPRVVLGVEYVGCMVEGSYRTDGYYGVMFNKKF